MFTPTIELDGRWEVDQSDVVMNEEGVVALVVDNVGADDLHPPVLGVLPHVVSPEHDLDRGGAIRAVTRGHDPLVRDEGAATEPLVINEQGRHPGVLMGGGLLAAHDAGVGAGHAAVPGHAPGAGLVARHGAPGREGGPGLELGPVRLPGAVIHAVPGGHLGRGPRHRQRVK